MLSQSQKLAYSGPDNDVFESAAHKTLIDVADYYRRRTDIDTYASLKPSLKPLKWTKNKREDNQRESELEALAAAQKKIVYIKTFNHVKNEAIVAQNENKVLKSAQNFSNPLVQYTEKHNNRNKDHDKIDYSLTLSIFKKNKEKFNPAIKVPKKKQSVGDFKSEESSTLKEFEFLTGVNIQGGEQEDQEQEENNQDFRSSSEDFASQQRNLDSKRYKIPSDGQIEEQRETETLQPIREQTNLPILKKTYVSDDKPGISVSEARYKKHLEKKPKIYISFRTNSVQPFGRPANYQDHLMRVYNKESTPSAQYPLISHIPPKKDMKKVILDCYLSQYNLEALRDIDETLYEYAKQQSAT